MSFGGSSSKKRKADEGPVDGGAKAAVELLESWNDPLNLADAVNPIQFDYDMTSICKQIKFMQSRIEQLEDRVKFLDQNTAHKTDVSDSLQDVINAKTNHIRTLEERVQTLEAGK
jgi:hypothetical protein